MPQSSPMWWTMIFSMILTSWMMMNSSNTTKIKKQLKENNKTNIKTKKWSY